MIKKVLIVNRGEIVLRAARTFRKLGIETVSLYSDADANSIHRFATDESVNLKGVLSSETYLDFHKILDAAKKTGVDSIFPGFGFVSENPNFVDFITSHDLRFIGPNSASMRAMGDKIEAKILAKKAGVNVIPGLIEPIDDMNLAIKIANEIGYPVILKAAAGGGGKGIRIVHNDNELMQNFALTSIEALNSFKDGRIFIEKYIENPRHIEIQIIGDKHGNIVHLGERECSIQRRYQKIIEEAPSPFFINNEILGKKIREDMGRQSVNLAKSIGYYSAGTVEFVVDQKGNFYFLEVNTRLQVEHPVTEEVTRIKRRDEKIDLIELMVRVENGEKLPFSQGDVYFEGHAIESRIYAENPEMDFIPSSGRVNYYNAPNMHNLRVETGVAKGSDVSIFYDPMIAKVCVYGKDRADAIESMKNALAQLVVSGSSLRTNINFLEQFICLPEFAKGEFSTNFIKQKYKNGFKSLLKQNEQQKLFRKFLIAAVIFSANSYKFSQIFNFSKKNVEIAIITNSDGYDSTKRIFFSKDMNNFVIGLIDGNEINKSYEFIDMENNVLSFYETKSNGRKEIIHFKYYLDDMNLMLENAGYQLKLKIYPGSFAEKLEYLKNNKFQDVNAEKFVLSPLPGLISSISVKEGDDVEVGSNLLIVEAMKMQNIISSQVKGKIKRILVKERESVQADQKLIEFE